MIGTKFEKPLKDEVLEEYAKVAEWCNENKATIEDKGDYYECVAIPEPTLEEARTTKLQELTYKFETASVEAHIMSSVGFEINADAVANRNIEGLTLVMSDEDTTMFCDYNNEFHNVTKTELETMRKEIVMNSQKLYQMKFNYRSQIESAETVEALNEIVIDFGY